MTDIPWELRRRALRDSIRHDTRVKEAIRQHLKELIAEETIITADGQKLVKLPLRYLDQYRFRFGRMGSGAGHGRNSAAVPAVFPLARAATRARHLPSKTS